jgi:hypothetical protein
MTSHKNENELLTDEFITKVMRQLPGLPEPRIITLLVCSKPSFEHDAQVFANEYNEPVALVDMNGRLLAYRVPQ